MSGIGLQKTIRNTAAAVLAMTGAGISHPAHAEGTAMTAGVVMDKMPSKERFAFVAGIIEGIAHSRFLRDSKAAAQNDEAGMSCIYDWFYSGDGKTYSMVEAAFKKYPDQFPAALLTVLINRECGE